ncbi:hypothetical protein K5F93_23585 [Pseudomonas protegens]|uniref:hypothetical protein n=1 Tax=Pseudomonas protegens TaxID=380021 RepID=UPI001C8D563C|nr:hypothetical protein [Pseudomonas protegens]QZI69321.1 hypothetical protein K5F93_23585 [Pseudomonas protegens]
MEIGKQIDIDPSIFRKRDGKHRELLNKYVKYLVLETKSSVSNETSIDALTIRNKELKRKVDILEKELKNLPSKLAPTSPEIATIKPNLYELDNLCMFIDDILNCQQNLQFRDGALYNLETFSEEEELVSTSKACRIYLDWKNGR